MVAGLITGGLLLFSGGATSFTYQGKSIAHASKTLDQADNNVSTIVGQRHGAKNCVDPLLLRRAVASGERQEVRYRLR